MGSSLRTRYGKAPLDKVATGSYHSIMATVNIKDAKNRLNELVRKSEKGETVTITRNGEPVADIVPHKKQKKRIDFDAVTEEFKRRHGAKKIISWVSPDFDDPLPEDFLITPLPEDFDRQKLPRKA